MMKLKEMTLQYFLYREKETAQKRNNRVLVSWTKKIELPNILQIFEAAESLGKDRLFWRNYTGTFTLVGIGTVHQIVARENRFEQLQTEWENILQQSLIHNPFEVSGTGLISMGGMSFDPKRPTSHLWEKYPPSQLTIPEFIFTYHEETYYMTVNTYVYQDEDIDVLYKEIEQNEVHLLSIQKTTDHPAQKIIAKKEIEPERWK